MSGRRWASFRDGPFAGEHSVYMEPDGSCPEAVHFADMPKVAAAEYVENDQTEPTVTNYPVITYRRVTVGDRGKWWYEYHLAEARL